MEEEAEVARRGQLFDTFQYNFAADFEAYKSNPALLKVLEDFRQGNPDLFGPVGSVRPEHFNDLVAWQFGTGGPVRVESLKSIIREEAVSPTIRGSASVAQLDIAPRDPEMLEYYRRQNRDSSAPLFATSTVAIYRAGTEADLQKINRDILDSEDEARVLVSMEAAAAASIIDERRAEAGGAQAVAEVASTDDDLRLRLTAVRTLRPFAFRRSAAAINALLAMLRNPRQTPTVLRAEAARVLGVGGLEKNNPLVRRQLEEAAQSDPDPAVRGAAAASLRGGIGVPRYSFTAIR